MTVLSPTVWCDPCIAPLVKALNDADMPTIASCCGHGTTPTSVILSDDRWVLVVDRETADRIYDMLAADRASAARWQQFEQLRLAVEADSRAEGEG